MNFELVFSEPGAKFVGKKEVLIMTPVLFVCIKKERIIPLSYDFKSESFFV